MAEFSWAKAAGLQKGTLSGKESEELDTLIFRKNCDYPYSQERIDELCRQGGCYVEEQPQ